MYSEKILGEANLCFGDRELSVVSSTVLCRQTMDATASMSEAESRTQVVKGSTENIAQRCGRCWGHIEPL